MTAHYQIVRENERGEPDDAGLPVIRDQEGNLVDSPYKRSPKQPKADPAQGGDG